MAKTLSIKFALQSGDNRTLSLSSINDDLTESEVVTATDTMIANNIFEDPIESVLKAQINESYTTVLIDNE